MIPLLAAGYPTDAEVMTAAMNVRTDLHGHDKPDMVRTMVSCLRLSDGTAPHAHLDTGGRDCAGGVSGPLVGSGDTLVMSRTDESGRCALVISRTGSGLSVIEQACGDWHGAACDFNGNYPPAR